MARNTFIKILGPLQALMDRSINEYGELVLKSVPILGLLTDSQREEVMQFSQTR